MAEQIVVHAYGGAVGEDRERFYGWLAVARDAAVHFVDDNLAAIRAVANAPLERQSLSGDDVRAIVLANPRRPE